MRGECSCQWLKMIVFGWLVCHRRRGLQWQRSTSWGWGIEVLDCLFRLFDEGILFHDTFVTRLLLLGLDSRSAPCTGSRRTPLEGLWSRLYVASLLSLLFIRMYCDDIIDLFYFYYSSSFISEELLWWRSRILGSFFSNSENWSEVSVSVWRFFFLRTILILIIIL